MTENEEHKCEIIEQYSKAVEFAEKKDIYYLTPEQFETELKKLSERYETIMIDIIDGVRNIILTDRIFREYKDNKQEIIEIADFIDSKERTIIHLKDFDKYLAENKCQTIYKFGTQRMLIYIDQILVETKKEIEKDIQYR